MTWERQRAYDLEEGEIRGAQKMLLKMQKTHLKWGFLLSRRLK